MELNSERDRLEAEVNRLMKYDEVERELQRAERKHPTWPTDMFQQLAIMQEEAGEVTKAVLHYQFEGGTMQDIRDELIQTAAMCMRMLANLNTDRIRKTCPYCNSHNIMIFISDLDMCRDCRGTF